MAAPVDKDELLALQKQFQKLSKKDHKNDTTITRKQFHEALKLVKVEATDTEILDRLFTLFDSTKTVPIHHHTSCALSHPSNISHLSFSLCVCRHWGWTNKLQRVHCRRLVHCARQLGGKAHMYEAAAATNTWSNVRRLTPLFVLPFDRLAQPPTHAPPPLQSPSTCLTSTSQARSARRK